jgi:hypothetical protein
MQGIFDSGRAVDLVLLIMLAEGMLLWSRKRAGAVDIALALLPGALILLGVRAALTGAAWPMIALPIALSWPIHLLDIRRRHW